MTTSNAGGCDQDLSRYDFLSCCPGDTPIPARQGVVREDPEDLADDDAFWTRVIGRDFERAREMGLPEPTWLSEKVLADYARAVGLDRKPRPVDPSHVRNRIRRMRQVRRMTQAELADKIGLSQSAVSLLEKGYRFIRLTQLMTIAEVLGVSAEWLVRPPEDEED